jgi:type I restriction enzyme S subunit
LRLRTIPKVVSIFWLFYRMSAPDLQGQFRNIATKGVSQSNINPTKMRGILLAVPPTHEQDEIVVAFRSLDDRLDVETARSKQLSELKSALMAVLLTGEVRVRPDVGV